MNESDSQECLDTRPFICYTGQTAKLRVIQVERFVFSDTTSTGRGQAEGSVNFATLREFLNIENEGESHDIVENKGPNFLSHDVYDK